MIWSSSGALLPWVLDRRNRMMSNNEPEEEGEEGMLFETGAKGGRAEGEETFLWGDPSL